MNKMKLNITFDVFTFRQPIVTSIIQKCVESVLEAEGVIVPCEINVFITNDRGIQAINKASREIDKPTDVLSFPMFQFEPENLPDCWDVSVRSRCFTRRLDGVS